METGRVRRDGPFTETAPRNETFAGSHILTNFLDGLDVLVCLSPLIRYDEPRAPSRCRARKSTNARILVDI
ncbi:hypothetical protein C9I57_01890 [Trinickia symbiotica]|uniref:Uncharacterized protein n=1 Tax=Trinickia symbiotica TaxID=863227 RepID=A0A2T3Y1A4_9BURK|nr:hypothetical protein C9I57_01890 [Trinickia symbiotica]